MGCSCAKRADTESIIIHILFASPKLCAYLAVKTDFNKQLRIHKGRLNRL